ncbi:uncharacterized protein [Nicotiana sylvestris]|uniref:uncharacterized protein n=1 Tax=Nicotiana sylvestris TaxID=4096 RepID=UPI00388C83DE
MTVSQYAIPLSDLSRHAPALVATVRERVHRFIEGLNPNVRFSIARELEMDIAYHQVVGIARRLEGMLTWEREEREAKRPRESSIYSGTRALVAARYGRGYVIRPVHSALLASSSILATPRPQAPYYAPPLSSAPPTRGAYNGQSSRSGPSQPQQPHPLRACFKHSDTHHVVKDFPRLKRGAPPQATQSSHILPGPQAFQSMVSAPVATPLAQPAGGKGRAGGGRPRGGGQAIYYALPARTEVVASDSVIIGIVSVCHIDASGLFDPGSAYSYVSSYFVPYLGVSRNYLSSPIYVSTLVGDSIIVNRVYQLCLVVLSGFETRANLLLLSMVNFDIILGMDWLSPYYVILDFHTKTVMLTMPGLPWLEWRGTLDYITSRVISFLKAQWIVEKGCDAYLAYVRDVSVDTLTIESVLIVRHYPDVFSVDLLGMLPDRDIDFGIDL